MGQILNLNGFLKFVKSMLNLLEKHTIMFLYRLFPFYNNEKEDTYVGKRKCCRLLSSFV